MKAWSISERIIAVLVLTVGLVASCGRSATPIPVPTRTKAPTLTPSATPTLRAEPTRLSSSQAQDEARTPVPVPTEAPTKRPTPPGLPSSASLGDTWVRPADDMVMVYVPAGTFQMGAAEDEPLVQSDEIPPHAVTLSGFWIDQTEVTNAQYARCVAAGACHPPFEALLERHSNYYGNAEFGDYPVIYVNWVHGYDYCTWVGGALPSEAQWEYAARGPDSLTYPWGNSPPDEALLNYDKQVNNTVPVGSYPGGASWCGALDMAGNVYEWVADWYGRYPDEAQTDPPGPAQGIGHVLRGGSWYDGIDFVRSANRYVIREAYQDYHAPTGHGFTQGFRCTVSP